jgi:hypothetical protein
MTKEESAKKYSELSAGWYEAKIREAYRAGWDDAERNMYEKAEALVQVLKEQRGEQE